MAIESTTLDTIKRDFGTGPDTEVLNLNHTERGKFWNWFNKRAIKLNKSSSPRKHLISKEKNICGRCYGNSQTITLSENIKYCEGFVKINGSFILHGFNVEENNVHDYTVLSNESDFTDINGQLPSEYYGVEISQEFIEQYNKVAIENGEMNIDPLLKRLFEAETQ